MNSVQKLRKLHRMTQNDVSDAIHYPKPLYAAFEHGKYIMPMSKLKTLAKVFNVSVDYLLQDMPQIVKDRYNEM